MRPKLLSALAVVLATALFATSVSMSRPAADPDNEAARSAIEALRPRAGDTFSAASFKAAADGKLASLYRFKQENIRSICEGRTYADGYTIGRTTDVSIIAFAAHLLGINYEGPRLKAQNDCISAGLSHAYRLEAIQMRRDREGFTGISENRFAGGLNDCDRLFEYLHLLYKLSDRKLSASLTNDVREAIRRYSQICFHPGLKALESSAPPVSNRDIIPYLYLSVLTNVRDPQGGKVQLRPSELRMACIVEWFVSSDHQYATILEPVYRTYGRMCAPECEIQFSERPDRHMQLELREGCHIAQ